MIITTSNLLDGLVPTIFTGVSTDLPENVTDPDFSTIYTSSDSLRLTMDFGITSSINYIAVAGINIEGRKDFTSRVRVYDGTTLMATNFINRNHCVVIAFDARAFSNLRIGLYNDLGNVNPSVAYVAAGNSFTLPNDGEMSGYNRQFLNRNWKNQATTNNIAAPTAVLRKRIVAKGSLNKPNLTKSFTETTWQDFLDFAFTNHFFIQEQPATGVLSAFTGQNSSSYMCYNVTKNTVTAHAQTRSLNNASISYEVFNGL